MGLLIFVAIVIVITVLLMWALYYVAMPPGAPAWIKNVLYIVLVLIALIVILGHTGWLQGLH